MNNIFINNNDIDGLQFGSSSVSKVYFGSNLVYEDTPTIPNYLQFTAKNGSATIGMSGTVSPNVSYSTDGTNWTSWDYSDISLNEDDTVYFKGSNSNGFNTSSSAYNNFTTSGTVEVNGNVMSLLYGDDFEGELTIPNSYCFFFLFRNCTGLTSASGMSLPATTLTERCYSGMFEGCTNLVNSPELPATTMAVHCYRSMFNTCPSLLTAPNLPSTTLAEGCYYSMFSHCSGLTTVQTTLPATTLTNSCYYYMFINCSSLTTAPVLPAKTLVSNCYTSMFKNCSSLNYIKAMFTTTPSTTYTKDWVSGVASSGTYVKNSSASYTTRGVNAIPTGWTIQKASS